MQIHMVTAVPEMTVRELAQTLLDANVRSVPVLGPHGKILGVASQADVMQAAMGEQACDHGDDASLTPKCMDGMRVAAVMGGVGPVVTPDDSVSSLVHLFVRERVQRALVVENDILLGIVTPIDVLVAIDEAVPPEVPRTRSRRAAQAAATASEPAPVAAEVHVAAAEPAVAAEPAAVA